MSGRAGALQQTRDSTLQGCTQNLTHSESQLRGGTLKMGQTHLLILENLPEREGATRTPPADWQQPFGGVHCNTWTLVLVSTILDASP